MVAVPTPLDPTAGDKLSAVAFDAGVRDPLNFMMDGQPRCHVWDSTGLSIPNSANTIITFDSETYDNDSMHNTVTQTSRITFTTAGRYDVDILLTIGTGTYTQLDLNIRLNSAGSGGGGTSIRTQPFSDGTRGAINMAFRFKRVFAAADHIELFVTQVSGAPKSLSTTSLGTRVFAERLSAT